MMKNQVYSWRLDAKLKVALEDAARSNDTTLSGLLEVITTEWLQNQPDSEADSELQHRLHESAQQCFGTIHGEDPGRSENVRDAVRNRIKRKRAS